MSWQRSNAPTAARAAPTGLCPARWILTCCFMVDLILLAGRHPIPHPDIALYAFMLRPLSEIAPDVIHPQTSENLGTTWSHFAGKNQVLWPAPLNDL